MNEVSDIATLIRTICSERLTYLPEARLVRIAEICRRAEADGLPGIFLEAGCALGGSSILIASLKKSDRPLSVYDVFGMIPPPTAEDPPEVHDRYQIIASGDSDGMGGDTYYGYFGDLPGKIRENFRRFGLDPEQEGVTFVEGMVQDTLRIRGPVAFAHIDVDWYAPVKVCLERIFPALVPGGSMVIDDYFDWGGCRKAADAFLERVGGEVDTDISAGCLQITKRIG